MTFARPAIGNTMRESIQHWTASLLKRHIQSDVRTQLRGIWIRGTIPTGPGVIAINHHSWWDGYLAAMFAWHNQHPFGILMDDTNLKETAFLRTLGVLGTQELRKALGLLRQGHWIFIFPEGRLCPAGPLQNVRSGAGWLAKTAKVPLYPLALRTVLRGHQYPEAYLEMGPSTTSDNLEHDLSNLLTQLDLNLSLHDPERPLPSFRPLVLGRKSAQERNKTAGMWLNHLLGDMQKP